MKQEYNQLFDYIAKMIKGFGEVDVEEYLFGSNGLLVNQAEFEQECATRGYNCQFVDALQARFQERSGWYFKVTKK